jgi:ParB/RepB/Spo0J family partition protein
VAHKLLQLDPKKLKPTERNARTHSEEQIKEIAGAIREFGFTAPLLVDERNVIIAGHGRHAAALLLKLKQVPVIVIPGLSKAKRRALTLADNRIALNSGWDQGLLALELQELQTSDVDLSALGFSDKELERLLESDASGKNGASVEYKEGFAVIIECDNERAQTKLLERFTKEGLRCKALIA